MFGKAISLSIRVAIILNKDQTSGNIGRSEYDDTVITKSSVANVLKVSFFVPIAFKMSKLFQIEINALTHNDHWGLKFRFLSHRILALGKQNVCIETTKKQ